MALCWRGRDLAGLVLASCDSSQGPHSHRWLQAQIGLANTGVLPCAGAKRFPRVERATEVATSLRRLASGPPRAPPRGGAKQSPSPLHLWATRLPSPPEAGARRLMCRTRGGVSRHGGGGLGSLRPGPSPAGSLAEGRDQSREADSFSAG